MQSGQMEQIDYVIAYELKEHKRPSRRRDAFEKMLTDDEKFKVDRQERNGWMYLLLECDFERLCHEAKKMKLKLPLKNVLSNAEEIDCCKKCRVAAFDEEQEEDLVSLPFDWSILQEFENGDSQNELFRPAMRGLIVEHILRNINLSKLQKMNKVPSQSFMDESANVKKDSMSHRGLPYLIMTGVYSDAFTLHQLSEDDFDEFKKQSADEIAAADSGFNVTHQHKKTKSDHRRDLNKVWPNICRYQPLWKIRNYFGEEIALYFAWMGHLVFSLLLPMLVGLIVFGYGLHCSITGVCKDPQLQNFTQSTTNLTDEEVSELEMLISEAFSILAVVKEAFDNDVTPLYAITICIWSTVFLEMWKRKSATLAYTWDVDHFEDVEPNRPEYKGTQFRKNHLTGQDEWYYPLKSRLLKYTISLSVLIFMVLLVIAILVSVTAYRVAIRLVYCTEWDEESPAYCFLVTTVGSALINALFVIILSKIYEKLAYKLTDWENHRTRTAYRDALIVKLFAFEFCNCYSSLFYIAFFRGYEFENGIIGLGSEYKDTCNESCMSELSFMILVLMLIKPLPRLLKDVIIPAIKSRYKKCKVSKNSVNYHSEEKADKRDPNLFKAKFISNEHLKPEVQDFTLEEYKEKIIQYGFLVLFASAMPLAPLIVVIVNSIDRVVDSKRLLWMYRRPVAHIAQDIGMWFNVLEFLSIAGVISNAFIIAYVSDWGKDNLSTVAWKLGAVMIFEHVILGGKYIISIIIPDVPKRIRDAMINERYTLNEKLNKSSRSPPENSQN